MPMWKLLPVGAVALAIGLTQAVPVPAIAAPPLPPAISDTASTVIKVDRRHHRHRGRNHDRALEFGLGIIGGVIASEAYRSGYYYDRDDDPDDDDDDDGPHDYYDNPYDVCHDERYCNDWD